MTEPSQSEEVERPQPFSTARQPSSGPISQTGIDPAYSQRALQRACQDEYGRGIWLDATPHPRHIVRRHIASHRVTLRHIVPHLSDSASSISAAPHACSAAPHACSAPANAPLLPCGWPFACGSMTSGVSGVPGVPAYAFLPKSRFHPVSAGAITRRTEVWVASTTAVSRYSSPEPDGPRPPWGRSAPRPTSHSPPRHKVAPSRRRAAAARDFQKKVKVPKCL